MEQTKHRTFRRADGVLGVGFLMQFAGVLQASIAWPDRQAQRFIVDDFERYGLEEVVTLTQLPHYAGKREPLTVAEDVKTPDGETVVKAGDQIVLEGEGATVLSDDELKAVNENPHIPEPLKQELERRLEALQDEELKELTSQTPTGDYEMPPSDAPIEPTVEQTAESDVADTQPLSEAEQLRNYLADHGTGTSNKAVIAEFKARGIVVTSQQVSKVKAEFKAASEGSKAA